MKRVLLAVLVACGPGPAPVHTTASPIPRHPLVPAGDWQVSPTEVYKGKQDDLYMVSARVGFYGNGAGKIYRTDDAGASWKLVLAKPGTYIRALGFLDEHRGFAGNIGPDSFPGVTDTQLLYRTDDGGASWTAVALPDAAGARGVCAIDILAVDAVNAGHRLRKEIVHVGGRVGGPASLHASDDGGATWKRLPLPPEVAMILDVHFVDVSTGFVFAGSDPDVTKSNGIIAKTTDSGRTWRIVYRSARPFELMWKGAFPSRRVGFATLQNYTGEAAQDPEAHVTPLPERYVVKTTDGGDTWAELPVARDAAMQEFGIGFVDERRGWIGALPNGFATEDGGATWKAVATMPVAANKLRVVRDATGAHVWAIGLDVRRLDLVPTP